MYIIVILTWQSCVLLGRIKELELLGRMTLSSFLLGWEMEPPTQQKELRVSLGAWGFCKAHCDTVHVQASSPVSIRLSPVIEEVGIQAFNSHHLNSITGLKQNNKKWA